MKPPNTSIMRSLGQCIGHIARGLSTPTDQTSPDRTERDHTEEVRRETTSERRSTPAGEVTLRRTTIEEITLPADPKQP